MIITAFFGTTDEEPRDSAGGKSVLCGVVREALEPPRGAGAAPTLSF